MHHLDDPDGGAERPTIVLVHGAFADASSWRHVIRLLQDDGHPVIAVQNHLASLADDVATTKRAIAGVHGPVVAVGHSYGGAVITGAAAGEPNVRALVYVAAFAPDAGEAVGAMGARLTPRLAPPALSTALVPDAAGFLFIDRARFHDVFCADVPAADASVMAATQKPIAAAAFDEPMGAPAWRTIPSCYLVSGSDRAINPELERVMAQRIGATTTEIDASHVPFLSHPAEVVRVIVAAAASTIMAMP